MAGGGLVMRREERRGDKSARGHKVISWSLPAFEFLLFVLFLLLCCTVSYKLTPPLRWTNTHSQNSRQHPHPGQEAFPNDGGIKQDRGRERWVSETEHPRTGSAQLIIQRQM